MYQPSTINQCHAYDNAMCKARLHCKMTDMLTVTTIICKLALRNQQPLVDDALQIIMHGRWRRPQLQRDSHWTACCTQHTSGNDCQNNLIAQHAQGSCHSHAWRQKQSTPADTDKSYLQIEWRHSAAPDDDDIIYMSNMISQTSSLCWMARDCKEAA